jgi:hypothetical protein
MEGDQFRARDLLIICAIQLFLARRGYGQKFGAFKTFQKSFHPRERLLVLANQLLYFYQLRILHHVQRVCAKCG